ncbi:reverse transcriptase domain-containing protein [Tanacetum coccineum]
MEEEKSVEDNGVTNKSMAEPSKFDEQEPPKEVDKTNEGGRRADDEPTKVARENVAKNKEEEPAGVSSSHAVGYYLKHRINEKLIEGPVGNQRFNDSLLIVKIPAETNIRLSLASHSYIYPLGIAKDVLVDIASYVYPMDFVILNIRKDEKRPFILGTPFSTTAKVVIKFDKGTITLKSGKSKISFHRIPEPHCRI